MKLFLCKWQNENCNWYLKKSLFLQFFIILGLDWVDNFSIAREVVYENIL